MEECLDYDGFSYPFHFLDSHGVVGFNFSFWFILMFLSLWFELLVLGALVGKTLWSPIIGWVDLLVLEPWFEKRSGALDGSSY